MGYRLSRDTTTVDITEMGVQSFSIAHPVETVEQPLLDDTWELQPRGPKAPTYSFSGNIPQLDIQNRNPASLAMLESLSTARHQTLSLIHI